MKRISVVLVATVALAISGPPAQAGGGTRPLTGPAAKFYVKKALKRRAAFRYEELGMGKKIADCKRLSRTRVRCGKVYWGYGDVDYKGWVTIWYSREGGQTYWNYAYRITRTNYYCLGPDGAGSNCRKVYRVR